MKKLKQKFENLTKKVKVMIVLFSLFTFVVITATYAWYISIREVFISSFDLRIETNLNLLLSLDGKNWDNVVFINEDNYNDPTNVYAGNTNAWSKEGLVPTSTIGELDVNSSRMILYQKLGISTTSGGFRLLAHRVPNTGTIEASGYVAFDLFIKNFSSKKYTQEIDELTEDAIYLGFDSFVKSATVGGVPGTGIENSVRIAFAQIGRVIETTNDPNKITSIKCNNDGTGKPGIIDNVTGLCRKATIWEPNDKDHVNSAIYWYNNSCLKRYGRIISDPQSYGSSCPKIADGIYYPTYAIHNEISEHDNVDVYDGKAFNGYTGSSKFLQEVETFTDSEKQLTGLDRKEIFTLAPNSITKVRVYVFIEGQDVDNSEYAQEGKRISIEFGFTKDRFTEEDVYDGGPDVSEDIWKPVITINPPETEITINRGDIFIPPTATAIDKLGENRGRDLTEDLTGRIRITNNVDTSILGEYEVIYNVSDWAGNFADPVVIKVIVV